MTNDPPATKAQLEYLTSLGVRLPAGLRSLPQHVAIRLIEEAEGRRGSASQANPSRKNPTRVSADTVKLVCAVGGLLAMILTVIVVRWNPHHPSAENRVPTPAESAPFPVGDPAPSPPLARAAIAANANSVASPSPPAPSALLLPTSKPTFVATAPEPISKATPAVASANATPVPRLPAQQPVPARAPMNIQPVGLTSRGLSRQGGLGTSTISPSSEMLLSPDGTPKAGGFSARLEAKSVLIKNGSSRSWPEGGEVNWEARITTLAAQPFSAKLHWFVIERSGAQRRVVRSGSVPVEVKANLLTSTHFESGIIWPNNGWRLDGWAMGLSTVDGQLLSTSTNVPEALIWLQKQPTWTELFAKPK